MFGSQALETAIGLAVLFFIISTAASATVEVVARLFKKRSKDLWKGISNLLEGEEETKSLATRVGGAFKAKDASAGGSTAALVLFQQTSIWRSAQLASGHTLFKGKPNGPSYLSAKAFADAVTEYLGENPKLFDPDSGDPLPGVVWPANLERRLAAMARDGQDGILSLKSGMERWFDEAMARAEGSYKRWATMILFLIGLLMAIAGNVSAISTAQELWTNPDARAAISVAAAEIEQEQDATEMATGTGTAAGTQAPASTDAMDAFTDAVARLDELGFPVGWDDQARQTWTDAIAPADGKARDVRGALAMAVGWFLTAALVMLGAPFWFDVLTNLVALRGAGKKPAQAADDDTSATGVLAAAARTNTPAPQDDQGDFAKNVGIRALLTQPAVAPAGPGTVSTP